MLHIELPRLAPSDTNFPLSRYLSTNPKCAVRARIASNFVTYKSMNRKNRPPAIRHASAGLSTPAESSPARVFATIALVFFLPLAARAADGTWINAAGGDWSAAANWQDGAIADGPGSAAKFDTLDVSGTVTVNYAGAYSVGSLLFGDTDSITEGGWLIAGSDTLALAASAAPSISVAAGAAALALPVGSSGGLTRTGAGTLVLAGPAALAGTVTNNGGVIRVAPGGSLTGRILNIGATSGYKVIVDGGYLEFNDSTASSVGNNAEFVINSGTAKFLRGGILTGNSDSAVKISVVGGEFFADVVNVRRHTANTYGSQIDRGFLISGGTATLGDVYISTANSWGSMVVSGGDTLVTGTFVIGGLTASSNRGGRLHVTGGRLTATNEEYGLIIVRGTNNAGVITLAGGTTTLPRVSFGNNAAVTSGSGFLTLGGAAALYVGAGGMVKNTPGLIASVTGSGGTLGADADWALAPGITVTLPANNTLILRAADEYGAPHDITIGAAVSGAGGFTKTGGGMLTLSATNNAFTGAMTLVEGGIRVTGNVVATSGLMSIPAGAAFGGSGTVARSLNYTAGSTLLVDVDQTSGVLAGPVIEGSVALGSTLTVKPIIPRGAVLESGVYPIIKTTTGVTGSPSVTWDYSGPSGTVTFAKANGDKDYVATVTMDPLQAPVITSALAVTGTESLPFSYTITADNWAMTYEATGLPEGLVLDQWTGEISGVTTFYGTANVTIKAVNRAGADTKTLVLTMDERDPAGLPVITSATSVDGTVDLSGTAPVAFNYQITASNPRIWGYGAAGLPAGLSLDGATGLISGTLSATGTTVITLSATNKLGTGTADLTLSAWAAPVITSPTIAMGMIDTPFSYQITADHDPVSFDWGGFSSDIFTINKETGVISLITTQTAFLVATGSVAAKNPAGTGWAPLEIIIDIPQPRITSEPVVVLRLGQSVDYQITTTRPAAKFHADQVPAGFSFDENTGRITGTPSEPGTIYMELAAENDAGLGFPFTLKIVTYGPAPSGVLLWTGSLGTTGTDGVLEATWDTTTQNWSRNGAPAAYADGADVYFDDSSTTERILLESGTYAPGSIDINVSGRELLIQTSASAAFGVSGTAEMRIQGTGTVTIAGANDRIWGGVTRLSGGVYKIGTYSGMPGTLGTAGPLMFEGGSLLFDPTVTKSRIYFASYIVVPEGVHALLDLRYAYAVNSNLEGSGTLEVRNANQSGRYNFLGENFSGALVLSGTGTSELPEKNSWDFAKNLSNLTLVIEDAVQMLPTTNSGGNTIYIGALAGGSPDAVLNGGKNGPTGKPNTIYRVGRKNTDTIFAGSIGDWLGTSTVYDKAELVKEGSGMLTLSGSHNYRYATTVGSGALRLTQTGRLASNESTAAVAVEGGAAFGGAGVVTPGVTFRDGAALLVDADPETGALAGLSVTGLVRFEGASLSVRPVVTGTGRIANGVYTVLFSENDFAGQPLLEWWYPDDPALQARLEYVGANRIQVTITGGATPMPAFTSGDRADGMAGQAFAYTVAATSDDASPTQLTVENLPAGLVFDPATGVISGTPAAAGTYGEDSENPILLHATNASGTATMRLTLVVYPAGQPPEAPVITSPASFAVVRGRRMAYQIAGSNFPTRFTATGLPNGVTVDANGLISGIPEILGDYPIPITASNLAGTGSATLALQVALPPPIITSPETATAIQHNLFAYQIEALNEPSTYGMMPFFETTDSLSVTGTRVDYLAIDAATGLLSGTCPVVATTGDSPLLLTGTVYAQNATGRWFAPLLITVNPPEPVVTNIDSQFFGVVGVPFTAVVTATHVWAAYKPGYGVTNIPPGLSVARANGEITGTPQVAGTYEAALVATNITGAGAKAATFTINSASRLGTLAGKSAESGTADGSAGEARFRGPAGGVADADGNLYIADTGTAGTAAIRKIAPDGTVSTLVLTGDASPLNAPSSPVLDTAGATLYVADTGADAIKKIDLATGVATTLALTGTPALDAPHALALATGTLYVADTGNNLIRAIDLATGAMTTLAGSAAAPAAAVAQASGLPSQSAAAPSSDPAAGTGSSLITFSSPKGLALSADGARLYVADTGNNLIRAIDLATGAVTTLAGSGAAGSNNGVGVVASFNAPEGLVVDAAGVLYVADTGNHTLRSIDVRTGTVITFAGKAGESGAMDGDAANSLLKSPGGLAVDSTGELYVFDTGNYIIRVLQTGPAIVTPPADQRVSLGSTATFSVVASGGPLPTYQWYKDELLLPGETAPLLTLDSVQLSDVARYRVVVTNPLGFRSAGAWLTIANANPNNPGDAGGGSGGGGGGGGAPGFWYLPALALLTALRFGMRRRRARPGDTAFSCPANPRAAQGTVLLVAFSLLMHFAVAPDISAQAVKPEGAGVITGRILNKATGQYLSDAIVTIEGTSIQAVTDSTGAYRLENVPAGAVRVSASYAGLDDMTKDVTVTSTGDPARADFDLTAQVYLLEKFVVAGDREGSARALQEQRVAVTQKAVFAADSFGNVVDNNIGELMKNLPGITIDYDGEDASTMRIRGMDPDFASITVDGNDIASIGDTDSRAFNLKSAPIQNIEKIEINTAPTADQPASTMGGQINIVTKSALRQKGRRLAFTANMSLNTAELNFDKTPGGGRTPDRKLMPGFNLSWSENFSSVFAFAFDVGYTRKYRYNNEYTLPGGYTYDTFSLARTGNAVTKDTTGYVTSLRWREKAGSSEDRVVSLNLDYEPWGPNHSFYLKSSYNDSRGLGSYNRYMQVNAGAHDPGSSLYDMISPTGVSVNIENNVNASDNRTYSFNAGAKHKFGRLSLDYNGYYSHAETNPSPEDNYTISYSTRGLGMNIFDLAGNATGQIVQTLHDGQGVVTPDDPRSYLNLDNYDRLTLSQDFNHGIDEKIGAKFNASIPVVLNLPFTSYALPVDIQVGASYAEQSREQSKYWRRRLMTGGSSEPGWTTAQPSLGQFADPYFKNTWGFGVPIPAWISPYLVNDYYEADPDAFYVRESDDTRGHMQTYSEMIAARQTTESTSAAYAQLTFRPLPTLTVIAGLRYEVQSTSGWKPEFLGMRADYNVDGTAITSSDSAYRNIYSTANANSQRNPTREFNQVAVRDPVTHEFIRFDEVPNPYYGMTDIADQTAALFTRKSFSHTFDGQYFPNFQFKWTTPVKNLTLRGARTTNIGRPRLNQVLADTEYNQGSRKVTTGNPQLKPSSSVKYDLALDYTTSRDGEIRLSLFRQDIKDYIHEETSYFEVTDLVERANDVDIFYYDDITHFPALMRTGIWTQVNYYNSGRGQNQGFEISYRQRLDILHRGLRNFSFYGSFSYADPTVEAYRHTMRAPSTVTSQTVAEYNQSPMAWITVPISGIQKRSGTLQLSYNGRRFTGRVAAFWVDNFARTVKVDPYLEITEQNAYLRFDVNFTYKLSSRWNATFDWRNMTDVGDDRKIYDRTGGYFTSGMVVNVGLKANF